MNVTRDIKGCMKMDEYTQRGEGEEEEEEMMTSEISMTRLCVEFKGTELKTKQWLPLVLPQPVMPVEGCR